MKNTIPKSAYFFLVTLLALGCDSQNDGTTPSSLRVTEITVQDGTQKEFEYDGSRLIVSRILAGGEVMRAATFEYQDDRLIQVEATGPENELSLYEFEYGASGLLEKETLHYERNYGGTYESKYIRTTLFTYDESNRLQTQEISYDDPTDGRIKYAFEWADGNIVKRTVYTAEPSEEYGEGSYRLLSYDDKKNYTNSDRAFLYADWLSQESVLSQNNITEVKSYSSNGEPDTANSVEFDYSYNEDGYPTESAKVNSSDISTFSYR